MISKTVKKSECVGCKLCGDICPTGAITFTDDKEGFWQPYVEEKKCINCKLCDKYCPLHIEDNKISQLNPTFFGAWSNNDNLRNISTSGGAFSTIASYWIRLGGVCYGAAYMKDFSVHHIRITSENELEKLRMSKYVQSDTAGIFKKVKDDLCNNIKVLFSGTPCQISALYSFLQNVSFSNDLLLTVDFVCHGVPSPYIHKLYIKMLEKRYHSKVKYIIFKHKKRGWHDLGTQVEFENGKVYFKPAKLDLLMKSYICSDVNVRLSCYHCPVRKIPHVSDFTLGDFWGVDILYPQYDDNKGTSLLMINSEKAKKIWNIIDEKFNFFRCTISDIKKYNTAIYLKREVPQNRYMFFNNIYKLGFKKSVLESCNENIFLYVLQNIKFLLKGIAETIGIRKNTRRKPNE